MYQKTTVRRMTEVQRKLALQYNELDRVTKRIRRLVDELGALEADALAWRAMQTWDIPKTLEEIEAERDALFPAAEPAELAEIGENR